MWMEKENGMNNERACSIGKLATTIIYCDVPSGITAWISEFLCLSLRNSRRITSGRTRRPWRRLATAHFSLKSLLKSPDISKCRSSVSSWVKWQNEGCLRRLGDSSANCRGLDLQAVGGLQAMQGFGGFSSYLCRATSLSALWFFSNLLLTFFTHFHFSTHLLALLCIFFPHRARFHFSCRLNVGW